MTKGLFPKRTFERAVSGRSTILDDRHMRRLIAPFHMGISHGHFVHSEGTVLHTPSFEMAEIWTLEKQLAELKNENGLYRDAVSHLLLKLRVALDLTESVSNFLQEELTGIENVQDAYVFKTGEVTNIWIQLLRRDVDSEMVVAETQGKIYALFPKAKLQFLVVAREVGNLKKQAPRSARRIRMDK